MSKSKLQVLLLIVCMATPVVAGHKEWAPKEPVESRSSLQVQIYRLEKRVAKLEKNMISNVNELINKLP